MNIFIAGGSGFIGTNLVKRLEKEHRVQNLDIRNGNDCNVNNYQRVHFFVSNADVVFHLANIPAHRLSRDSPKEIMMNNYATTLNIAEACRNSGCKKIVFLSSFAIYGNETPPWDEGKTFLAPTTPYGITKLFSEVLLKKYHEWYGLDIIIIRPSNVFGPHEELHQPTQVIPQWLDDFRSGRSLIVNGEKTTRDFTYVDDLVESIYQASKKSGHRIYNLCSGEPLLLKEVALHISDNMYINPLPPGETEQWWGSCERAKFELDFKNTKTIMEWIDERKQQILGKTDAQPRMRHKKDRKPC